MDADDARASAYEGQAIAVVHEYLCYLLVVTIAETRLECVSGAYALGYDGAILQYQQ